MIAFIRGQINEVREDGLIIDMNGLGINVFAPIAMMTARPKVNTEIFLYTYMQVKDDGWNLFGFPAKEQQEMFNLLLSISGIGPKVALNILNTVTVACLVRAISNHDPAMLPSIRGVGKKTVDRIILELKSKVAKWTVEADDQLVTVEAATDNSLNNDVLAALLQLGYPQTEARALVLKAAQSLGAEADAGQLIKAALKFAATL